jgi:indolepyruvate ferredoxin oxidoreductase
VQLTGDEIGANMMLLGYAWQKGLVPVGRAAIAEAIAMNGVSIAANTTAFDWGRILAQDPQAVLKAAAPATPPAPAQEEMTTEAIITHRAAHLRQYQNAALAERYTARLASLAQAVAPETLRQAAISYARVLAYKDEYEVARLYADPAFRQGLQAQFDGDYRISFNLAPPMLPGKDSSGRPKKRAFGPWILPVFGLLARLKGLRGTWADPFGYSQDRKTERALIALFEADLSLIESLDAGAQGPEVAELLALPQAIRGYGPVKEAAFEAALLRRGQLRDAITKNASAKIAAA